MSNTTLKFSTTLAISSSEKVKIYCQIFSQKNLNRSKKTLPHTPSLLSRDHFPFPSALSRFGKQGMQIKVAVYGGGAQGMMPMALHDAMA
jgi:hypothetical protein